MQIVDVVVSKKTLTWKIIPNTECVCIKKLKRTLILVYLHNTSQFCFSFPSGFPSLLKNFRKEKCNQRCQIIRSAFICKLFVWIIQKKIEQMTKHLRKILLLEPIFSRLNGYSERFCSEIVNSVYWRDENER